MGEEIRRKRKKKQTSKLSNTYTNKVNKKAFTPYLLKKKNDKVVAIKVNKQANKRVKHIRVPKETISNMKSTKKVWDSKGK
jgi:hypothetical protein